MNLEQFLDMGGYARFVWPSYGLVALVLIWQGISSWTALRAARRSALEQEQTDDADSP